MMVLLGAILVTTPLNSFAFGENTVNGGSKYVRLTDTQWFFCDETYNYSDPEGFQGTLNLLAFSGTLFYTCIYGGYVYQW